MNDYTDLQLSKRMNAIVIQLNMVASDLNGLGFTRLSSLVDDAITEAVFQDIILDDLVNSKI